MNKLAFLLLLFFTSHSLFSQEETKNQHPQKVKIGLSGNLQASQYGISVPLWLGKKFVLAPSLGFTYAETVGSDLSLGLEPRFYFKNEKLAPYFGIKMGTIINIPSSDNLVDTETKYDLLGGLSFGAEYFFAEYFSVGVETQGNFTKSDENSFRYGNPDGLNFNMATQISATIYFN